MAVYRKNIKEKGKKENIDMIKEILEEKRKVEIIIERNTSKRVNKKQEKIIEEKEKEKKEREEREQRMKMWDTKGENS